MAYRLSAAIAIKALEFFPAYFSQKWLLTFAYFQGNYREVLAVKEFFYSSNMIFSQHFLTFSVVFWMMLRLEGRSRIVARILRLMFRIKESSVYLQKLPEPTYDKNSHDLGMCLFTSFYDQKGEPTIDETQDERWVDLKEAGLRTNTLIVGPTGGGKTSALIMRILSQSLRWQSHNPAKKASIVVYDPKAELSELAIKMAKDVDRSDDLIVLELGGEHRINPIKVDDIWSGKSSWQVAGWIVAAWQNFQGRSNPEPYWESQNYILTRNLLVILYMHYGPEVTLYSLSTTINRAAAGCFSEIDKGKSVNEFGFWVLSALAAACPNEIELELAKYNFPKNLESSPVNRPDSKEIYILQVSIKEAPHADIRQELESELALKMQEAPKPIDPKERIRENGRALRREFCAQYPDCLDKLQIVIDASRWLLDSWSSNNPENRGSIISNMQPFLQQFETPELVEIFSSRKKDSLDFKEAIASGKIIVPKFSGINIGNGLSSGIITLIKSRWQSAALQLQGDRIKVQIMDEAQRVLTLSDGNNNLGDLDYMELSRSFGGMTFLASQSIAALRAKANRAADWEKVHGVVRSVICLSTNDPITIDFMCKVGGKTIVKRVSRCIAENANAPHLETISEKYRGETDSLSVSYTTSESLEDKIQAKDIQNADAFSGVAVIYDGKRNHLLRISLRPTFWPHICDTYELLKRCEFDPEKRQTRAMQFKVNLFRFFF